MSNTEEEKYLAKVGDNYLSYDDIAGYGAGSVNAEDSIAILKGYVNTWIKEQLLIKEAEHYINKDFNIEKLVKDYRSSLILNNYIEEIVSKELDTIVTNDQIAEYYQNNKQQYILSESIVKYQYAKLRKDQKGIKDFEKRWNASEKSEIVSFCEKGCEYFQLNGNNWRPASELLSIVPSTQLRENDLKKQASIARSEGEYKYYVKIVDFFGKEDVPPLEYIEGKIVSVILNDRKQELIKRKKQVLFEKYFNTSSAKSFVELKQQE